MPEHREPQLAVSAEGRRPPAHSGVRDRAEDHVSGHREQTFAVYHRASRNFMGFFDSREEAEADANHRRELNPDMPADEMEVLNMDDLGGVE